MRQRFFKTESTGFALQTKLRNGHVLSLSMAEGSKRLPQSTNLVTCSLEEVRSEPSLCTLKKEVSYTSSRELLTAVTQYCFQSCLWCTFYVAIVSLQAEATCTQWNTWVYNNCEAEHCLRCLGHSYSAKKSFSLLFIAQK